MSEQFDRELEIFAAALKLGSPAAWAGYVQEACGGDSALRERVESLLRAHEEAGTFLQDPPAEVLSMPAPGETNPPLSAVKLTERPGSIIGRYKLLQEIGEGGFGVVYMAEQTEPVTRRVALKIIKLGMDTRQVIARFEAERQALAMMDHPNIAKVLDAGATNTGRPYFVMELVRGIQITEYCDKNHLTVRERLELFIPVCQAIQHAHQKGVIHRDIKPSNVLVTLHDGKPIPMVIDFGIAKATNQKLTEKTLFTNLGAMIGTPAYMSPEQAELSKLDVDTRSDIYSLGVLMYELLTGTTPFSEERLRLAGYLELQRIIADEEPERPSARLSTMEDLARTAIVKNRKSDAPSLGTLFRGDLDWIVMKCLEKDRSRRYETATDLAADLQRQMNDEPIVARPPSRFYRFQKLVYRNRLTAFAVGAVAAALLSGFGISTHLFLREREARQRAVVAEKAERHLRLEAELSSIDGKASVLQREKDYKGAEALYRKGIPLQQEFTGQDHRDMVQLMQSLALTVESQGRFEESESIFRDALAILRRLPGDVEPLVARSLYNLAERMWDRSEFKRSEVFCREALAIQNTLREGVREEEVTDLLESLARALTRRAKRVTPISQIIPKWGEVTDLDGDCEIISGKSSNNSIKMTIPGTPHDLSEFYPSWIAYNAPRVVQEVTGDFSVQVKVSGSFDPGIYAAIEGRIAFNGAGLLLWDGTTNYLRLESNIWGQENGPRKSFAPLFEYWKDGNCVTQFAGSTPWEKDREMYLRLTRQQDTVTAAISYDGIGWVEVREAETQFPKTIRVGVAAINTSQKPFTVEFSEFGSSGIIR